LVFDFMIHHQMNLEFTDMRTRSFLAGASAMVLAFSLAAGVNAAPPAPEAQAALRSHWVATWQASPQPVWETGFLFPTKVPTALSDQTIRQVARISLGGSRLRIVLSNAHGTQPLNVGRATVARPRPGAQPDAVDVGSLQAVTFAGLASATIPPGASLVSDPVPGPVLPLTQVTVSIHLPETTPVKTFHWDGRQTGWIVEGDQTGAATLRMINREQQSTTARLLLTGIQVETDAGARAVAVIGDSITDGATAGLDADSRWPDFLANRLAPHGVAVVNAGISGARLLSDGMGINALARLERDVLTQPGVHTLIVMLGINDIAWPGTAFARDAQRPTLAALVAGYRQMIARARSHGIRVIGATLTPFEGALPGTPLADYYQRDKDALRQQVNAWIRHGEAFDAVIDFDAALRDPARPARLRARFDSGDHLHPGDEGNRAMAEVIDLGSLLRGPASLD
jgi:lysophospholipase L1-like esterase